MIPSTTSVALVLHARSSSHLLNKCKRNGEDQVTLTNSLGKKSTTDLDKDIRDEWFTRDGDDKHKEETRSPTHRAKDTQRNSTFSFSQHGQRRKIQRTEKISECRTETSRVTITPMKEHSKHERNSCVHLGSVLIARGRHRMCLRFSGDG